MEDSSLRSLPCSLNLGTNIAAIPSIYLEWDFLSGLFMFYAFGQVLATYTHYRWSPSMQDGLAGDASPYFSDRRTDNTSGQWIFLGVDIRVVLAYLIFHMYLLLSPK